MKTPTTKLVTFTLGADLFAAEIHAVERVLRYVEPSAVPDVPAWIEGVIDHANQVIPVVDLRRRIEVAERAVTASTRILVLATSGGRVGAIVDTVHEVATVPTDGIAPPPPLFRGLASDFICGIARVRDQLVVVLDVDRVLTSGDRLRFERSAAATAGAGVDG